MGFVFFLLLDEIKSWPEHWILQQGPEWDEVFIYLFFNQLSSPSFAFYYKTWKCKMSDSTSLWGKIQTGHILDNIFFFFCVREAPEA